MRTVVTTVKFNFDNDG